MEKNNSSPFDDLPEPEYDHLALGYLDDYELDGNASDDSDNSLKKPVEKGGKGVDKKQKQRTPQEPHFILGTLIVRVVAARDLESVHNGGGGGLGEFLFGGGKPKHAAHGGRKRAGGGTANPYASVKFGASTQKTSQVFDTLDPVWPRNETMFMDVTLPLSKTTHPDLSATATPMVPSTNHNIPTDPHSVMDNAQSLAQAGTVSFDDSYAEQMLHSAQNSSESFDGMPWPDKQSHHQSAPQPPSRSLQRTSHHDSPEDLDIPKPVLTVAVFSAMAKTFSKDSHYPSKKGAVGDSDDDFLGMATVDLTPLLTGKRHIFDEWLPLYGNAPRAAVRVVCEYEASDTAPSPGDRVRFTRFCHPADLYPVSPGRVYQVQDVDGDDHVVLSYTSPEGWVCSFVAHRWMLICVERHHDAVEACREELQSITERLSHSPLVGTVAQTVESLPEEGLLAVGASAIQGGASLLDRWFKGGLDTAVGDVMFATNWDGRFNPNTVAALSNLPASGQESNTGLPNNTNESGDTEDDEDDENEQASSPALISLESTVSSSGMEPMPLPGMLVCPITGEPMIDPVVAADGHTYERAAIARWLQTSDKSPLTGSVLPHKELVPNYGLLSSLQEQAALVASAPKSKKKKPPSKGNEEHSLSIDTASDEQKDIVNSEDADDEPSLVEEDLGSLLD